MIGLAVIVVGIGFQNSRLERLMAQRPASSRVAVPQACLDAIKMALGPGASVLRYGALNTTSAPEVIAAVKLKSFPAHADCTPVSRMVILRLEKSGWKTILDASKQIKNSEGYVGIDYIDDSSSSPGYCLQMSDHRSDSAHVFTIFMSYLNKAGDIEGSSIEISWNSKLDRYQEFADVEGFLPEVKNPPHRNPSRN